MVPEPDEREDETPDNDLQDGEDTPPHDHVEGVDDGCGK